jgi:hypothetical protein
MAEIRINATGGVKLYDADDSHYAQIIAGTITSNTDVMTLGHNVIDIPMTTASSSATTGALTIGGGLGVAADLYVGDDTYLITDSAVLGFGADKDTTLTHTDGTGLTLNSTNKLCFNDATQFVQGISGTVLGLGATDEIDLTATTVDLNGTLNVSGVATFQAAPVFPDGSLALADLDIDGGTDIGADLVDADEIIVDDGGGGTNRRCDMSRVKTYIGGGITHIDQWRLTTDFTGDAEPLENNLEQNDTTGAGLLGSAMTVSSGIWTFPATGMWWIHLRTDTGYNGNSTHQKHNWYTTQDNSTYTAVLDSHQMHSDEGATSYSQTDSDFIFDCTNVSNDKVKVDVSSQDDSATIRGSSTIDKTWFRFIRLADT